MVEQETSITPPHVLSIGSFGRAVAQNLRDLRTDLVETLVSEDTIALPAVWPKSCAVILASWRPVPHFCELLDKLSFTWETPFVPVILDSTILRIGPVVVPGHGSCWSCWARRCMQHEVWQEERRVLVEHYASHPAVGPQGFLEPFAMMAAARVASILKRAQIWQAAGDIWQINVITRETTTGIVVGVHDCPKCGFHSSAAERSFSNLRRDLAYLWMQGSNSQ